MASSTAVFERFKKADVPRVRNLVRKIEVEQDPNRLDVLFMALVAAGDAPGDAGELAEREFMRLHEKVPVVSGKQAQAALAPAVKVGDVVRIVKGGPEASILDDLRQSARYGRAPEVAEWGARVTAAMTAAEDQARTPLQRIEVRAAALQSSDPKLTRPQAVDRALRADPSLYAAYRQHPDASPSVASSASVGQVGKADIVAEGRAAALKELDRMTTEYLAAHRVTPGTLDKPAGLPLTRAQAYARVLETPRGRKLFEQTRT